jgi:O-antigen/teichoic acid export membrane protein
MTRQRDRRIMLASSAGLVQRCAQLATAVVTLALHALGVAGFGGAGVAAMVAAVYGGLLAANAGSLAHLLLRETAARPRWRLLGRAALWAVAAPGGLLFMLGLAGSCAYGLDTVLALRWLGPAAAAQITVALRICTTATGFLAVVTQPL